MPLWSVSCLVVHCTAVCPTQWQRMDTSLHQGMAFAQCYAAFVLCVVFLCVTPGGLMSDATKLPAEQQEAAMASISAEGLPQAIERQAAAGVTEGV